MLTKMEPIEATRRGSERRNMRASQGARECDLEVDQGVRRAHLVNDEAAEQHDSREHQSPDLSSIRLSLHLASGVRFCADGVGSVPLPMPNSREVRAAPTLLSAGDTTWLESA